MSKYSSFFPRYPKCELNIEKWVESRQLKNESEDKKKLREYLKKLDTINDQLIKKDCFERSIKSLEEFIDAFILEENSSNPKLYLQQGEAMDLNGFSTNMQHYEEILKLLKRFYQRLQPANQEGNTLTQHGNNIEAKKSHVKHESPVNARAIAVAALLCSCVPEEKIKDALKKYGINSWKHYRDIHNGDVKDNYFTSKKIFTKLYHFKTCLNAFNSAFNVLKNDFNLNYPDLINAQTKWVSHVMQMIDNKSNEDYLVECMDLHDEIKEKLNETLQNP